jgi:hypothetical protein
MPPRSGGPPEYRFSEAAESLAKDLARRWESELKGLSYQEMISTDPSATEISEANVRAAAERLFRIVSFSGAVIGLQARASRAAIVLVLAFALTGLSVFVYNIGAGRADKWSSVAGLVVGAASLIFAVRALWFARKAERGARVAADMAIAAAEEAEAEATAVAVAETGNVITPYSVHTSFLWFWIQLESGIRKKVAGESGVTAPAPFSAILHAYTNDKKDLEELRGLLQIRNRIVHSPESLTTQEVSEALPLLVGHVKKMREGRG